MKINQRTLSAIKPGIRKIQWDDGLPGFGVRVTEGATTYVVDFKVGSRRRRVSLGRTDLIKYQAARIERLKSSSPLEWKSTSHWIIARACRPSARSGAK